MTKTLVGALAVVLVFGILTAFAEENCAMKCAAKAGASAVKKASDTKASCCQSSGSVQTIGMNMAADEVKTDDKTTGCAMHSGAAATATSAVKEETKIEAKAVQAGDAVVSAKAGEAACPDVKGQATMENFHNVLHKMHTAYKDKKYDEIRSLMPAMAEKSEPFKTYVCPMSGGKCSAECLKDFESKKTAFLTNIDGLNKACATKDNALVDAEFMKVHESYVTFASTCNPSAKTAKETPGTEATKATETK